MSTSPVEHHLTRAERRSVETLLLRPVTVADRFAQARGSWKDAPVMLVTRAFEGNAIAYLRVAHVTGVNLSLATLLAVPRANRAVPLLSVDVARLGADRETLLTADLTPLVTGGARVSGGATDVSWLTPSVDRPAWCDEWCSPRAIHARVLPARMDDAMCAVGRMADGWLATVVGAEPAPERADAARTRTHAYMTTRRADPQWLSLLGTMFGRAWTDEYIATVLFPTSLNDA